MVLWGWLKRLILLLFDSFRDNFILLQNVLLVDPARIPVVKLTMLSIISVISRLLQYHTLLLDLSSTRSNLAIFSSFISIRLYFHKTCLRWSLSSEQNCPIISIVVSPPPHTHTHVIISIYISRDYILLRFNISFKMVCIFCLVLI